jgi:hypothetical protein
VWCRAGLRLKFLGGTGSESRFVRFYGDLHTGRSKVFDDHGRHGSRNEHLHPVDWPGIPASILVLYLRKSLTTFSCLLARNQSLGTHHGEKDEAASGTGNSPPIEVSTSGSQELCLNISPPVAGIEYHMSENFHVGYYVSYHPAVKRSVLCTCHSMALGSLFLVTSLPLKFVAESPRITIQWRAMKECHYLKLVSFLRTLHYALLKSQRHSTVSHYSPYHLPGSNH